MAHSKRQLDQKIMRVCISYTYLFSNKFQNTLYPQNKYKMCFRVKMQDVCTLWSKIKSSTNQSTNSGSIGSKMAHAPKLTVLGQGLAPRIKTRQPRKAQPPKLGAVGTTGRPADHLGRLTSPWAPPPSASYVAACHWLPMAVHRGRASSRPWLPPINIRGGGKK